MKTSILILALALFAAPAFAASDTWTGATDGDFSNTANWLGGSVPGNTSGGTTSTPDVATFTNNVNTIVVVDSGRTVNRLLFDTANVGPFSFTGATLTFNGTNNNITISTNNVARAITFFTDLRASAGNRSISFVMNPDQTRAQRNAMFNVFGNITGGASGASGGTVSFNNNTRAVLRGVIADGSTTGRTGLSMDHQATSPGSKAPTRSPVRSGTLAARISSTPLLRSAAAPARSATPPRPPAIYRAARPVVRKAMRYIMPGGILPAIRRTGTSWRRGRKRMCCTPPAPGRCDGPAISFPPPTIA